MNILNDRDVPRTVQFGLRFRPNTTPALGRRVYPSTVPPQRKHTAAYLWPRKELV